MKRIVDRAVFGIGKFILPGDNTISACKVTTGLNGYILQGMFYQPVCNVFFIRIIFISLQGFIYTIPVKKRSIRKINFSDHIQVAHPFQALL
jgi:hypothetical protein